LHISCLPLPAPLCVLYFFYVLRTILSIFPLNLICLLTLLIRVDFPPVTNRFISPISKRLISLPPRAAWSRFRLPYVLYLCKFPVCPYSVLLVRPRLEAPAFSAVPAAHAWKLIFPSLPCTDCISPGLGPDELGPPF